MTAQPVDAELRAQAADWFARLQDASQPTQDRERALWQAWLAHSPAHGRAWAEVEAVWGSFERLPPGLSGLAGETLGRLAQRRRRLLKASAASALGLGALALLGWQAQQQAWDADLRTARAQLGDWPLAGGGRLWLNAESAADLDEGPQGRRIRLRRGELLLQAGADSLARTPQLLSPQGGLRALHGSRLSLRLLDGGAAVLLSVFEGLVTLDRGERVPAGRSLRFSAAGPGEAGPARLLRETWRRGLLVAEELRLDEFLAELAPYHPGRLDCAPELAGLRLVGSFPLADSAAALQALCLALPVRQSRLLPGWTRIVARP